MDDIYSRKKSEQRQTQFKYYLWHHHC